MKVKGYLYKYARFKFIFIPKGTRMYRNHIDYQIADTNMVLEFKSGLEIPFHKSGPNSKPCPSRATKAIRMAYKIMVDYCKQNLTSVHTGNPIGSPRDLVKSAIERHGIQNQYKKHADYFEVIE